VIRNGRYTFDHFKTGGKNLPTSKSYGFLFSVPRSGGREVLMPGIDFRALRTQITMTQVLELLRFEPQTSSAAGLRGPCPIHRSQSPRSRSFVVHVGRKMYCCFRCGSAGNHLDLYAAVTQQGVYQAALDLCAKLHQPVPWLKDPG
jgi:DNA primase